MTTVAFIFSGSMEAFIMVPMMGVILETVKDVDTNSS
jgi:hypothetical protein